MTADGVVAIVEILRVAGGSVNERGIQGGGPAVGAEDQAIAILFGRVDHNRGDLAARFGRPGQRHARVVDQPDPGPPQCFLGDIGVRERHDPLRQIRR